MLGEVRSRLAATRRRMEELLAGVDTSDTAAAAGAARPYDSADEMLAPLTAIYWSLWECGSGIIAEGRLLDLIRRVACFGLGLMRVDLRQDAARHTSALDAVTTAIGAPSYAAMNEEERVAFLAGELGGRRPLIPPGATLPPDDAEVVATFRVAASLGPSSLGAYVISMATQPSDVLAVQLLMREVRRERERRREVGRRARFKKRHTTTTTPLFLSVRPLRRPPPPPRRPARRPPVRDAGRP